jgi:hypothetical protein
MFLDPLRLKKIQDNIWLVDAPLRYTTYDPKANDYVTITVPKGFETDGASSPFGVLITPLGGKYSRATVLHDYLYVLFNENTPHPNFPTRWQIDGVFLEAMEAEGVNYWVRYGMWVAVRMFGNSEWIKDLVISDTGKKLLQYG